MTYHDFDNPIKRAFYREAHAFIHPHPTDDIIQMMWRKWWRQHKDTPKKLEERYYDIPEHQEWSIYDWNVDMYDWWEKNISTMNTETLSVFDNL